VQIAAPHYSPEPWKHDFSVGKGKTLRVDLENDVKLTKTPDSPSQLREATIVEVPPNVNLPPLQKGKGFKPSP
jgi:hypothetical protein